jgi:DNA-binding response OmpR family regulator
MFSASVNAFVWRRAMRHIAIIDDETDIANILAHCFACEGFQVNTASDGLVGLDVVRRVRPDLVTLNLKPCSVREVIARSRAVLRRTARTTRIREGSA